MGILGNMSRNNLGAIRNVGGGAQSLTIGNGSNARPGLWLNALSREGQTTALGRAAFPTGYTPQGAWRLAIAIGEMSLRMTGTNTFTANLFPSMNMVVALTGVGGLTAEGRLMLSMIAALTGSGTITADINGRTTLTLDLTGSGDLIAAINGRTSLTTDFTGSGDLAANLAGLSNMIVALVGSGDFTADITGIQTMVAALTGSGDFAAVVSAFGQMNIPLTGSGDLTATATAFAEMLLELSGSGILTGTMDGFADMEIDIVVTGTGLSVENIGEAVWSYLLSCGYTAEDAMQILTAVAAGKTTIVDNGGGSADVTFRDLPDTKDVVVADMLDSERIGVVLDP